MKTQEIILAKQLIALDLFHAQRNCLLLVSTAGLLSNSFFVYLDRKKICHQAIINGFIIYLEHACLIDHQSQLWI